MACNLKVGERVRVKDMYKLELQNPEMKQFLGEAGVIIKKLPREWKDTFRYGRFRIRFDNPSLLYHDSNGHAHNELNFFPNELERTP